MESLSVATPIVALCALLGWLLVASRGLREYSHIAALLTWWTPYNIARAITQAAVLAPAHLLLPDGAPYVGVSLWGFYLETALRLTWPFAILAVCLSIFRRRGPWVPLMLWAVAALLFCAAYPRLRGESQRYVEAAVASACWIASAAVVSVGHRRHGIDPPGCYMSLSLILGTQLAVLVVVQWLGREEWPIAQAIQSVGYTGLLCYQAVKLWKPGATN